MVIRILPQEFRAKASAEGPCGKRALQRKADPLRSSDSDGKGSTAKERLTLATLSDCGDDFFPTPSQVQTLDV